MSQAKPGFGLAYFNPGLLDREDLIAGFVARRKLLEKLVGNLHNEVTGQPAQHHLLLGQRGMGKSTLLLRLRYAVEDDPELSRIWLPLSFPEEQYNIRTLSDFWVNCLDALGDALESSQQNALAESLDDRRDGLPKDEEVRSEAALRLLLELAEALDRRLILLIDNLDIVFDRLKEKDWAIRKVLSSQPSLLLIGAASQAVESAYNHGRAFYDFFRIHEVRGLDFEETKEVLIHLAELRHWREMEMIVKEQPGRIRTLHTLSGGNPRTILLLYEVLESGYDGDAKRDLERLLDLYTPLYKARVEELSEQHQQVVDALATLWDPATAAEVAESLRLDVNTVSAALTRLEQREGIVEKVSLHGEKKLGFQLAERFFNIWYLMRTSRRSRKRLTWLVKFLRLWYDQKELRKKAATLMNGDNQYHPDYGLALAEALEDRYLRAAVENHALCAATGDGSRLPFELGELPEELQLRKDRIGLLDRLRRQVENMRRDWDGIEPQAFWRLLGGSLSVSLAEKEALVGQLAGFDTAKLRELFDWLEQDERRLKALYRQHEIDVGALYNALATGGMADAQDWDQAPSAIARYIAIDTCLFDDHRATPTPDLLQTAEAALTQMMEEDGVRAWGWHGLGNLRKIHQRKDREAEQAYRKAVEIDPNLTRAWMALGELLGRLERHDEAETAYRGALNSDPDNAEAWNNLGWMLQHPRMQRYDEAETAYRTALKADPNNIQAMNYLARLLLRADRFQDAEDQLKQARQLDGNSAWTWHNLGELWQKQSRLKEAEDAYRKATQFDPQSSLFARSLANLLLDQARYAEAEPAYWQALAQAQSSWSSLVAKLDLVVFGRKWWRNEQEAVEAEAFITRLRDKLAEDYGDAWLLWAEVGAARQDWPQALHGLSRWAQLSLPQEGEDEGQIKTDMNAALDVLATLIRAGQASPALQALETNGVRERWRPLYEAMKAAEAGTGRYLSKVAPEVRQAALDILQTLSPKAAEDL